MREILLDHKLFRGLSADSFEQLMGLSEKITLAEGDVLVSEGEETYDLYLIVKGNLAVLKKSNDGTVHRLGTKKSGDFLGELAFITPGVRSATLKAEGCPCELIKIKGEKIRSDHKYIDLYAALSTEMGKLVSDNLRYTNEVTVKAMQAELRSAKLLVAAGRFMVSIVFIISAYIFCLGVLPLLAKYVPTTTPISIGLLIFIALTSFIVLRGSGFPYKNYGLTLENWGPITLEAILFSIPIMLFIVLLKWIAITAIPAFSDQSLFQPFAVLKAKNAQPIAYLWIPLAYALFCPIQEFIARGVLQSSFHMFLTKDTWALTWYAIVLANLLFAATHMHTSFGFAILAFIPGLFWGWLFARQQSLVGVSVSHILIGLWAVFIVSFQHMA